MSNANDFQQTIEDGVRVETKTLALLDEIMGMYKRVRRYHFERRRAYSKMQTALKKGNVKEAARIYRNEMPAKLKYTL